MYLWVRIWTDEATRQANLKASQGFGNFPEDLKTRPVAEETGEFDGSYGFW
jgi:hypothetical protein